MKNFYLFACLLLLFVQLSFSVVFTGIEQSRMDADIAADLNLTISSSGIELNDNYAICSGLPLTVNLTFYGFYENITNALVPCPTFGCGPRPSVPSDLPPFSIMLVSRNDFINNISVFYNTIFYPQSQPPYILGRYNFTGNYYNPPPDQNPIKSPPASFIHGMFCYGNTSIFVNNSLSQSYELNDSLLYMFVPPSSSSLSVNSSLISCAVFVRTWETDGPTRDSVYTVNYATFPSIKKSIIGSVYNGPNLTLTPTQTDYVVTPGSSINFTFKLNNSGDVNATITNVQMSDGFTVQSFSPSTVEAGRSVDFIVTATAPNGGIGAQVRPTISFNFDSTIPLIGTCGSGSVANVDIGNVTIGEIGPISVKIYVTPSGFFNEGTLFIPGKANITARISRADPKNYKIEEVESNISIFYYNTGERRWDLKFNVTGIIGSDYSASISGRNITSWNTSDGIFINLNETISSSYGYRPGIYKVEIKSSDEYVTNGPKYRSDFRYFVIFNLPGCAKKV